MRTILSTMMIGFILMLALANLPARQSPAGFLRYMVEAQFEKEGQEQFTHAVKNYDTLDKTAWNEFSKDLKTVIDINEKINSIPYIPDEDNYKEDDYWAAPQEMIAHRGGDCEDYAIAKYFALIQMGFDEKTLKILVVDVPSAHAAHAVLLIGNSLVLNNGISEIYPIQSYVLSGYYVPLYTINQEGLVRYTQ